MSPATDDPNELVNIRSLEPELIAFIRRMRRADREGAIDALIESALTIQRERERASDGHEARLRKHEGDLERAVEWMYGAMHPEPLTREAVERYRRTMKR